MLGAYPPPGFPLGVSGLTMSRMGECVYEGICVPTVGRYVRVVLCPHLPVRVLVTMFQVCVFDLELPGLGLSFWLLSLDTVCPATDCAPWLLKTLCVAKPARPYPCWELDEIRLAFACM